MGVITKSYKAHKGSVNRDRKIWGQFKLLQQPKTHKFSRVHINGHMNGHIPNIIVTLNCILCLISQNAVVTVASYQLAEPS